MTVDFPSSYPASATTLGGKPVDVQTLQEAFAVALRNYGTEKNGTTTGTMLEVLRPSSHADNADGNDRNQQRREQRQQIDRSDITNIDRKMLDKSEMRSTEMNADYRDRIDRNETLRSEHQGRVEHRELPQPTAPASTSSFAPPTAVPVDIARPTEPVPNREPLPPQNIPTVNNPSPLTSVPNSTASTGLANVLMPGGNVPLSIPTPAAPQVIPPQIVPPQAFTVFTPQGRFGQTQGKTDDQEDDNQEDEDEEPVDETVTKKAQPFAEFEAIRSRQNVARKPKEPVAEKPRERPKESEPNQVRSVKTMEEFLNSSPQSITVAKKGEQNQPNQTQYINRIAAACEAVSHYAPIRIKLNLDHLGTLTLRFYYQANKLTLRFETPSKDSSRFIHDHLGGLQSILSKRNVKIANIEILEATEPQS